MIDNSFVSQFSTISLTNSESSVFMANLSTKTKYINIVVRKKDFNIQTRDRLVREWCNSNCELYCYIYHLHDINLDGEVEEPHLHLVCTLKSPKRLSTILNSFCAYINLTTLGVMIDKVNSYQGSIQYLLHKNDPQKTPHVFEDLVYNYDPSELKTIIESENDCLTAQRLYEIVRGAKNNYDIICAVGLTRYHMYRNVIRDIKEDFGMRKKSFQSSVKD